MEVQQGVLINTICIETMKNMLEPKGIYLEKKVWTMVNEKYSPKNQECSQMEAICQFTISHGMEGCDSRVPTDKILVYLFLNNHL